MSRAASHTAFASGSIYVLHLGALQSDLITVLALDGFVIVEAGVKTEILNDAVTRASGVGGGISKRGSEHSQKSEKRE